jgi:hypothetical protein
MYIELGNIHAKWNLLIENTCMLLVNRNVTMWNTEHDSECMSVIQTNGTTNCVRGMGVPKLIWRETETAMPIITRTDIGTFSWAHPAHRFFIASRSSPRTRPRAVRQHVIHSDLQVVVEAPKMGIVIGDSVDWWA